MKVFEIRFTKQAKKDIEILSPKLKNKCFTILSQIIAQNPYLGKKLGGELGGYYSYRLTLKDRIVYLIDVDSNLIYVQRARTHYGE